MKKSQAYITLHELRISVEPDGIQVQLYKYPTTCTGKNYIPQMVTDEMRDQGFSSYLSSRVKLDEIMKVQRASFHDSTSHIGRYIYFLDGQQDQAKALVKKSLEETITRMKDQMDKVSASWIARTMRPRKSRRSSEEAV